MFLRSLGIQPSVIVQGVVRHSQFYRFQLRIPLSLVTETICVKAACCFEQLFCMSSFAQLSTTEQVAEEARSKMAELKDFHSTCVSEKSFAWKHSSRMRWTKHHVTDVAWRNFYVPQRRSVERCTHSTHCSDKLFLWSEKVFIPEL